MNYKDLAANSKAIDENKKQIKDLNENIKVNMQKNKKVSIATIIGFVLALVTILPAILVSYLFAILTIASLIGVGCGIDSMTKTSEKISDDKIKVGILTSEITNLETFNKVILKDMREASSAKTKGNTHNKTNKSKQDNNAAEQERE